MDYASFIRFGENRKGDISLLLRNKHALAGAIEDLAKPFRGEKIDQVVGLEARGFIFASAIAYLLEAGFVMVRKSGALSCEVLQEEVVDYSKTRKCLEVAKDAIQAGERVLIVDDWIETGSQIRASCKMIESLGGNIVGVAALVNDTSKEAREFLEKYHYHHLIDLY